MNILEHSQSIGNLYKKKTLDDILKYASQYPCTKLGDLEFSEYQREVLQRIFPGFTYEFCTTSTITPDAQLIPGEIITVNLNLSDDIIDSYMQHMQDDELSPVVYLNPGRALNYTQVCADENVAAHPFFINHCHPFKIHKAISVGYLYPEHTNTFITFDYLGDEQNKSWHGFFHSRLELASFPFALAWLYRRKVMDQAVLSNRFKIMQDLTERQLENLRKFINSPEQSFKEQADKLGIELGTLKDDLYNTRRKIMEKLASTEVPAKGQVRTSLRALEAHCSFLRMLEDHTKDIVFPEK